MSTRTLFSLAALVGLIANCDRPLRVPGQVRLSAPSDGALVRSARVVLSWESVADADHYLLEVSTSREFKFVAAADTLTATTTECLLLVDGDYYWRVVAVSRDGIGGQWSDVRKLSVVRYALVASLPTVGYAHAVAVSAGRAYVAAGQAGLVVVDVADPESPYLAGMVMDSLNEAWGVAVRESVAFVACGVKELMVVDVRRPDSLVVLGVLEYPQPGFGYDVAARDSFVYVAADAQFIAVNCADPRYPNLVFQYYYPRSCRSVAIEGGHGYVVSEQLGVASWNLDTFPPRQIGSLDTPGNARGIAVKDGYLFVADGRNGLVVVDASDPVHMQLAATLALPGYANAVSRADSLVVVGCGDGGVQIVNVAVPTSPRRVAAISTPYAMGSLIAGRYIYACDRDQGLVVIRREE